MIIIIKNIIMRKLMTCVAAFNFATCPQKMDAAQVPNVVKVSFAKQYSNFTNTWENEGGKYAAGFFKRWKDNECAV